MINVSGAGKQYTSQGKAVHALEAVDLQVANGDFLVVVGRSGCGKSTLLNLLGGLDVPTSGSVLVAGHDVGKLTEAQLTRYRRETVGIIFQFFNLMPLLTVLENVALPALLAGKNRGESQVRARSLIEQVGLTGRAGHQASLLSGGEMQRVAVARALINDPPLILADEPTGNLDSHSAEIVLDCLKRLNADDRKTVVMVTHSREAAAVGTLVREMRDGHFLD